MKILFTGGFTGGHFYPLIAVAEAVRERCKERKIIPPTMYYMAPNKYNARALFDNELEDTGREDQAIFLYTERHRPVQSSNRLRHGIIQDVFVIS